MYTKRELKRAAGIIRQIARDNHVTEEEVRRDMKEAISVPWISLIPKKSLLHRSGST